MTSALIDTIQFENCSLTHPTTCLTHIGEKFIGYCRSCDVNICGVCGITCHKGEKHDTTTIEALSCTLTEQLNISGAKINENISRLDKNLVDVTKAQDNCDVSNVVCEKLIHETFEKAKLILETHQTTLLHKKDTIFRFKRKEQLEPQKLDIELRQLEFSNLKIKNQQAMVCPDITERRIQTDHVQKRFKALSTSALQLQLACNGNFSFQTDHKVNVLTLGAIYDGDCNPGHTMKMEGAEANCTLENVISVATPVCASQLKELLPTVAVTNASILIDAVQPLTNIAEATISQVSSVTSPALFTTQVTEFELTEGIFIGCSYWGLSGQITTWIWANF